MDIKLDIAGMYYGRVIHDVPAGANVRDVMVTARDQDRAARLRGGKEPALNFMDDCSRPNFINTISVHHVERAKSRQTMENGHPSARSYDPGEYIYTDDAVAIVDSDGDGGQNIVAIDARGRRLDKTFVQVWQYYVYDEAGREQARGPGSPTRKVVGFGDSIAIRNGFTVVWRLVTIFIQPTWAAAYKGTAHDSLPGPVSVKALATSEQPVSDNP